MNKKISKYLKLTFAASILYQERMLATAQSTHTGTLDHVYHDSSAVCRQTGSGSDNT